jgi:hypothetical protein
MEPRTHSLVVGSIGICPVTIRKSPQRTECEYGAILFGAPVTMLNSTRILPPYSCLHAKTIGHTNIDKKSYLYIKMKNTLTK